MIKNNTRRKTSSKMTSSILFDGKSNLFVILVLSVSLMLTLIRSKSAMATSAAISSGTTGTSFNTQTNGDATLSYAQPFWAYQQQKRSSNHDDHSTPHLQQQSQQLQQQLPQTLPLFDTLRSLSQRQGSLSASPFLSILPIILIAAGGLMLLLPLLTMSMASSFGGFGQFGGAGGAGGFGFPQVTNLNRRRSSSFMGHELVDLLLGSSSTSKPLFEFVDELGKKLASSNEQIKKVKNVDEKNVFNQTS